MGVRCSCCLFYRKLYFWGLGVFSWALSLTYGIGCIRFPVGIGPISLYVIPVLNMIVLLALGFRVTRADYSLTGVLVPILFRV